MVREILNRVRSCRVNILVAKCLFGESFTGEVSGQRTVVRSGKFSPGKCQSGNCAIGKLSYNQTNLLEMNYTELIQRAKSIS